MWNLLLSLSSSSYSTSSSLTWWLQANSCLSSQDFLNSPVLHQTKIPKLRCCALVAFYLYSLLLLYNVLYTMLNWRCCWCLWKWRPSHSTPCHSRGTSGQCSQQILHPSLYLSITGTLLLHSSKETLVTPRNKILYFLNSEEKVINEKFEIFFFLNPFCAPGFWNLVNQNKN